MRFSAGEMEWKKPFEATLPPEALVHSRVFVEKYRPLLLAPDAVDQGYLWPSRAGGMGHRSRLGRAVKAAIFERTGKEFNFHLFRHSAATFIFEVRPEQTQMAAKVLHHSSLGTTNKHYIKGKQRRTFKLFQSAVREIIAKGRRRQSGRRPKKRGTK